jgi:hypothetical protein
VYVRNQGASGSVKIELEDSSTLPFTLISQSSEREFAECSNRGICDHASGMCTCFLQFVSSDGKGGKDGIGVRGTSGDCGAIAKHVPGSGVVAGGSEG